MLDFQLFRIKVRRITGNMFSTGDSNEALVRQVIESHPERSSGARFRWHVGNVEPLDANAYYFAFGRSTRSPFPVFDRLSHSFAEREFDSAPFTHVIIDAVLGVAAIARQTHLASKTEKIARQLELTFSQSQLAYDKYVTFDVEPISDPEQFIEQIRSAEAVLTFSVTFSRPNPFDAADFQVPMERYLEAADADEGRTTIAGHQLDREVVEEMSRSAAATGHRAFARLIRPGTSKPVNRHLGGNIVHVSTGDQFRREDRTEVLQRIRDIYHRLRRHGDG